jgi:MarR family transcriptional regulator for hemolysin
MRPQRVPIGLQLGRASRVVSRAFDEALEEAGGTLPIWLILLNLSIGRPGNQRELADAVGVREATLTHHLNGMDTRGLITRRRDTDNRRIHVVELTDSGKVLFGRLQQAAIAFDTRLRHGLPDADLDTLGTLLDRLSANVDAGGSGSGSGSGSGLGSGSGSGRDGSGGSGGSGGGMPWAGLAEKH